MAETGCPKCNTPMAEERRQDSVGDWWIRWVCDCTPDETWTAAEWIGVDIMVAELNELLWEQHPETRGMAEEA